MLPLIVNIPHAGLNIPRDIPFLLDDSIETAAQYGQGEETPDTCIGFDAPHYAKSTLSLTWRLQFKNTVLLAASTRLLPAH